MYPVEFISYGNGPFDINKFRSPKNIEGRNKPSGGLWASPVGYHPDWKEFLKNDPPSFFRFRLRRGAKIYIIDCSKDLETLLSGNEVIDFENTSWDGILLTEQGLSETKFHPAIYGWDIPSLILLNMKYIEIL